MASVEKNLRHQWRVNGVNELLDTEFDSNYEIFNSVYNTKSYHDLLWEITLIFNGSKSKYGQWISLQLKQFTEGKRVKVNFKIWMVTQNGTKIRMNHDALLEIDDIITYTIPKFINKDGLFINFEEYAPKNVITFVYEFDIESIEVISRPTTKKTRMDPEFYDDDSWTGFYDDSPNPPDSTVPSDSMDFPDSTDLLDSTVPL